jgi:hypothetical protein
LFPVVKGLELVWAREKTGGRRQEKNKNIESNFMKIGLKKGVHRILDGRDGHNRSRAREIAGSGLLLMEGNGSALPKEGALVFSG